MCVGKTVSDIKPPLLEKLGQEGRFGDVGVGVHADEVRGVPHSGSGFPHLLEQGGVVVSSFSI